MIPLTLLCITLLLVACSLHACRVFSSPLSKFPGPKLWALSRIPYVLAMRSGTLVHRLRDFHERYGSVIRIAPDELSFTDPAAASDIYASQHGSPAFPKNPLWFNPPGKGQPFSILNADNANHARIRRAWSYGFSDQALKAQEPLIASHVDLLIQQLESRLSKDGSTVQDLNKWFGYCAFDIIGSLAFGESFDCLQKDQYHVWVYAIVFHFKAAVIKASNRFFPWFNYFLSLTVPRDAAEKQRQHFQMAAEKVSRRLKQKKGQPDFLSHLQRSREGLTDAEIQLTAATIITAGSNSTTTTLCGTVNFLLQFPDALAKLTDEIRAAFPDEASITLTALTQLPYLSAVVDEALRIISPVPLGGSRVTPPGGASVNGIWLPGGITVQYMQWAASHSRKNFSDPDSFIPERWLGDPKYAADRQEASLPFLLGPRSCIGRQLALFEVKLVLARMIWNFDIEAPFGTMKKWEDLRTFAVWA